MTTRRWPALLACTVGLFGGCAPRPLPAPPSARTVAPTDAAVDASPAPLAGYRCGVDDDPVPLRIEQTDAPGQLPDLERRFLAGRAMVSPRVRPRPATLEATWSFDDPSVRTADLSTRERRCQGLGRDDEVGTLAFAIRLASTGEALVIDVLPTSPALSPSLVECLAAAACAARRPADGSVGKTVHASIEIGRGPPRFQGHVEVTAQPFPARRRPSPSPSAGSLAFFRTTEAAIARVATACAKAFPPAEGFALQTILSFDARGAHAIERADLLDHGAKIYACVDAGIRDVVHEPSANASPERRLWVDLTFVVDEPPLRLRP